MANSQNAVDCINTKEEERQLLPEKEKEGMGWKRIVGLVLLTLFISSPVTGGLLAIQTLLMSTVKTVDETCMHNTTFDTNFQTGNIVIGTLVVLGAILTFNDQMALIITRRTFLGVDPLVAWLGYMSSSLQIMVVFLQQTTQMKCILHIRYGWGLVLSIPFWEVAAPAVMFLCILLLCLIYNEGCSRSKVKLIRQWLIYGTMFLAVALGITMIPFFAFDPIETERISQWKHGISYGFLVCALCFSAPQWLPQILELYRLKDSGSLSLIMLAIQGPGTLFNAFSLIIDKQSPLVYAPLFSYATEEIICLTMAIYYKYRMKHRTVDKLQVVALDRPLGGLEKLLATDTYTVCVIGHFSGTLNPSKLNNACYLLLSRHPQLRAIVRRETNTNRARAHRYADPEGLLTFQKLEMNNCKPNITILPPDSNWEEEAIKQIEMHFDPFGNEMLWRVVLIPPKDDGITQQPNHSDELHHHQQHGHLLFVYSHAIGDGFSGQMAINELLVNLTLPESEGISTGSPRDLSLSLTNLPAYQDIDNKHNGLTPILPGEISDGPAKIEFQPSLYSLDDLILGTSPDGLLYKWILVPLSKVWARVEVGHFRSRFPGVYDGHPNKLKQRFYFSHGTPENLQRLKLRCKQEGVSISGALFASLHFIMGARHICGGPGISSRYNSDGTLNPKISKNFTWGADIDVNYRLNKRIRPEPPRDVFQALISFIAMRGIKITPTTKFWVLAMDLQQKCNDMIDGFDAGLLLNLLGVWLDGFSNLNNSTASGRSTDMNVSSIGKYPWNPYYGGNQTQDDCQLTLNGLNTINTCGETYGPQTVMYCQSVHYMCYGFVAMEPVMSYEEGGAMFKAITDLLENGGNLSHEYTLQQYMGSEEAKPLYL